MTIVQPYPKRFFRCIGCDEHEFSAEHVMAMAGESFRWVCDNCGRPNEFTINADGTLSVSILPPEWDHATAVAHLYGHSGVFAIMRVLVPAGKPATEQLEHARYWLEEHTCPTNPEILDFVVNGDPDLHGMWKLDGILPDFAHQSDGNTTHDALNHVLKHRPDLYGRMTASQTLRVIAIPTKGTEH